MGILVWHTVVLGMPIQRNNYFRATICWTWEFSWGRGYQRIQQGCTRYKAHKFKLIHFIHKKSHCDHCFVLMSYIFFTIMFASFSSEIDFQLCFCSSTEFCMFTFFSLFLLWLLSIVIEQTGLFLRHAISLKHQFSGVHAVKKIGRNIMLYSSLTALRMK
jgi:hypothetical protein